MSEPLNLQKNSSQGKNPIEQQAKNSQIGGMQAIQDDGNVQAMSDKFVM